MVLRSRCADWLRGWWTILAITLATALFAHLAFDVVADGWSALLRPLHLVYALVVCAAFGCAARDLSAPRSSERRRRGALLRARLHGSPRSLAAPGFAQLALAAIMFGLEPQSHDGVRLAVAALAALVALLFGALIMRRVEVAVLRLAIGSFARRRPRPLPLFALDERPAVAVASGDVYRLFRPKRPPPIFA